MATANDKLQDESLAHAIWVSRYSTGVANRMITILNDSDAELTARLLVAIDTLDAESFTVSRLQALLVSVRAINKDAIQSMYAALTTELQELAKHEATFQMSLFQFAIPDDVLALHPLVGISPDAVYAAAMGRPFQGRLLSEWASNLEADRMARISNTVRQGFLLGDTQEQIAKKVRGHANRGYQDGALQMSRANAASIAKTAVGHLASTARHSFAAANDDILKGKQWLSTLDNRTSKDCRIRDRLKYTLDNKPIGHKVPYLQGPGRIHFCCRSTETYILKSAEELGIDVRELPEGTRASMDGQVAGDTTYSEWLQRQPFSRQKEILGETRAKMMRDGVIKYDEFFTDKGEWLTLEQLRERSVLATNLDSANSVEEVAKWMTGRVAQEVRFPDGVSLDSAKEAAQAAFDVIQRFRLQPVSAFGDMLEVPASIAGAYEQSTRTVHVAGWALDSSEWDYIRKNSEGVDMTMMVREHLVKAVSQDVLDVSPADLPYVATPSIKGTVWHELGHHLYYSRTDVGGMVESAYDEGWWRSISAYASEAPKELFAEIMSAYMSGNLDIINPEILQWLKQNSRS